MKLTTVVIDDSPLQRLSMCKLVENHAHLVLLESFGDPITALGPIYDLNPDILILDVEMPVMNAFDLIEHLEHDCQIILNSTSSQFAVQAFQYPEICDFLSKPITPIRFERSVKRALDRCAIKQRTRWLLNAPTFLEKPTAFA
ncbi:MAG: response regulator [Bacteroidota bacterium]